MTDVGHPITNLVNQITALRKDNVRLARENAELRAADRDHDTAHQGYRKRTSDQIRDLERQILVLQQELRSFRCIMQATPPTDEKTRVFLAWDVAGKPE
jgi:phage shock protein A